MYNFLTKVEEIKYYTEVWYILIVNLPMWYILRISDGSGQNLKESYKHSYVEHIITGST